MKPSAFDYHAPRTVDTALELLQRYSDDARLLAGGQTLLPMMNFRIAAPSVIIDLNRIQELAYIKAESDRVRIGAMTRQRAIEFSPVVAKDLPLLREAIRLVGHLPTRSRGTIGGSIANADPAAELPMILQALEGEAIVVGPNGQRVIAAADLFCDAMTTSIEADEILTELRFPVMTPGAGYAVEEFSRRRGDFAVAAIAVMIVQNADRCRKARIATAGISSCAGRLYAAEQALEGKVLNEATIAQAAELAAEAVDPLSDRNASPEFRRHLTRVLTQRAILRASGVGSRTPSLAK